MAGLLVVVGNGIAAFANDGMRTAMLPGVVPVGREDLVLGTDKDGGGREAFQQAANRCDAFRLELRVGIHVDLCQH